MPRHLLAVLLVASTLLASPVLAQDHDEHHGMDHVQHVQAEPDPQAAQDRSAHGATEHVQHGHAASPTVDHSAMDHLQMDHGNHAAIAIPAGPPPPRAFEGPQYAADRYFDAREMAAVRAYNHRLHGGMATGMVLVKRLEARLAEGEDGWLWDVSGWYGTATDKVVFKSEGEGELSGSLEDAEAQLLWGHAIGPFIELQAGMQIDLKPDTRTHLVLGAAGLAPYMIHFDAALFLSDRGDLTGRIEAEHDIRVTQRLILQPRAEIDLALQDIPERGIGAGLPRIALGARLRYEIERELAPYFGVEYEAATGRTADRARAAGGESDSFAIVAGLRFWF